MSLKTGTVSICVLPSTLGLATRAAQCVLLSGCHSLSCPALPSHQRPGRVLGCARVFLVLRPHQNLARDSRRNSSLLLPLLLSLGVQPGRGRWEQLSPVQEVCNRSPLSGAKHACGSCFLPGRFPPRDQRRDFVLSSYKWIPNPPRRAGSSLLEPSVLGSVCHSGTSSSRFMPAEAQNQRHVCLMRSALLTEAGAGPANCRGRGAGAWAQRGQDLTQAHAVLSDQARTKSKRALEDDACLLRTWRPGRPE